MIRKTIFWVHLISGGVSGIVILMMSVTGVLLTFQSQIVGFANRSYSKIAPPDPFFAPLDIETVLQKADTAYPDAEPTRITVRPDRDQAYVVQFGRLRTVFVNPYTGDVRGEGNIAVRDFLREIMFWHRWFSAEGENRAIGRAVTGACNMAFCLLIITGLIVWWPKKGSWSAFRNVVVPKFRVKGRKRDFNWHNVVGFWCLPVLFLISVSGVVISYGWAGDLVYTLTGTPVPQRSGSSIGVSRWDGVSSNAGPLARYDDFIAAARKHVPEWAYITLNLPKNGAETTTLSISEMDNRIPITRSTLTVSTRDAHVVKWVRFSEQTLGSQVRTWLRWIHTGEAGGWPGQLIAGFASLGAVLLVWTGFSLSWHRFRWYLIRGN